MILFLHLIFQGIKLRSAAKWPRSGYFVRLQRLIVGLFHHLIIEKFRRVAFFGQSTMLTRGILYVFSQFEVFIFHLNIRGYSASAEERSLVFQAQTTEAI